MVMLLLLWGGGNIGKSRPKLILFYLVGGISFQCMFMVYAKLMRGLSGRCVLVGSFFISGISCITYLFRALESRGVSYRRYYFNQN